jgi:hypothetical protein
MDYETQEGKTAMLVAIDLENVEAISALAKNRAGTTKYYPPCTYGG